jgi:uncharacterized membrane protein
MITNVIGFIRQWDAYVFILLNLIFSIQAAYEAPIIMMSKTGKMQEIELGRKKITP